MKNEKVYVNPDEPHLIPWQKDCLLCETLGGHEAEPGLFTWIQAVAQHMLEHGITLYMRG